MTDRRPMAIPDAPAPADPQGDAPADPRPDAPTDAASAVPPDLAAMPFDRALAELQAVVGRLEAGGLALEESIDLYERGVALHEHCSRLLTSAELRVQRLVEQAGGKLRAVDLSVDDEG